MKQIDKSAMKSVASSSYGFSGSLSSKTTCQPAVTLLSKTEQIEDEEKKQQALEENEDDGKSEAAAISLANKAVEPVNDDGKVVSHAFDLRAPAGLCVGSEGTPVAVFSLSGGSRQRKAPANLSEEEVRITGKKKVEKEIPIAETTSEVGKVEERTKPGKGDDEKPEEKLRAEVAEAMEKFEKTKTFMEHCPVSNEQYEKAKEEYDKAEFEGEKKQRIIKMRDMNAIIEEAKNARDKLCDKLDELIETLNKRLEAFESAQDKQEAQAAYDEAIARREALNFGADNFTMVSNTEDKFYVYAKDIAYFAHGELGEEIMMYFDSGRSVKEDLRLGITKKLFAYNVKLGDSPYSRLYEDERQGETATGHVKVVRQKGKHLDGDDGRDLIVAQVAQLEGEETDGFSLQGLGDDDRLLGSTAADILLGGDGKDYLDGRGGEDDLEGGDGDDLLVLEQAGFRKLDGGLGSDTLRFSGAILAQNLDGKELLADVSGIEQLEVFSLDDGRSRTLDLSRFFFEDEDGDLVDDIDQLTGLVDEGSGKVLRVWGEEGTTVHLAEGYDKIAEGTGAYRGYDGYDLDGDHNVDLYIWHDGVEVI